MNVTEDDIREAAERFDAELGVQGLATFTPEQIRAFQAVAAEPDVFERARKSHDLGLKVLRDAEESQRRYEEVRRQAEEMGIDLSGADLDGDARRARDRATEEYLERARREVAADARRLFGSAPAEADESPYRLLSRGAGRMRI